MSEDKKQTIVVDINSVPKGLDWDVYVTLINEQNIILWDSMPIDGRNPVEPKPMMVDHTYRIVDIRQLSEDERKEYFNQLGITE